MLISQKYWTKNNGWKNIREASFSNPPQLVFVFGSRELVGSREKFDEIKKMYPESHILLCSTSGEIIDTIVNDDSLSVTAVLFEKTKLQFAKVSISNASESHDKGKELASTIPHEGLKHVMVFSEGLKVNGTALVEGLIKYLPREVAVTGGLVGDKDKFKETAVGLDEPAKSGIIILVGFYGDTLKVGYGSLGGWDPFGPERMITKSDGNVLYELDGKPALSLYKEYLGEKAKDLPASGLLFPLSLELRSEKGEIEEVVRTLLAVDEEKHSMTFAGDMPQGTKVKLMKANFERLVDGASGAAEMSGKGSNLRDPDLAILISCVGRKLVLKERVEEETEAVRAVLGDKAAMCGFYSYGEVSPVAPTELQCRLHNQTMTITTFKEG